MVASLITAVFGRVLGGLLKFMEPALERLIPRLYKPQFAPRGWKAGFSVYSRKRIEPSDLNSMKAGELLDEIIEDNLTANFIYAFEVEFFSRVGIGLRDLTVVFVFEDGDTHEHQPCDPYSRTPLRRLNLPARTLIPQEVNGTFRINRDSARRLRNCERVKFKGHLFTGAAFEWTVVEAPMEILIGSTS